MLEPIRCPRCGGLNPPAAEWCGQCLQRFEPPRAEAPPPPPPPPGPSDASPGVAGAAPVASEPGPPRATVAPGTARGAFRVAETGVVWICSVCESENALDDPQCTACGASFAQTVAPKVERVKRDPGTTAMISLFFPGAGHAYLGMWGQAIARGVTSLWVIAVVFIAALQKGLPGSGSIPILFSLAAFGLWVVSAHDAYREANEEPGAVILKPRYFLYLVLGLLFFLFMLVFGAGLRASSG